MNRILLAPMEGLLDFVLRDVLTRPGGIDRCVSEFIRVTGTLLPDKTFLRIVPELRNGSRTAAGVPVRPQLLGSDPTCLAENAAKLSGLAPEGIDLNFGCPARTVNRHRGGAVLLDEPELVHAIVAAVRRAVPAHLPVSAKMRLGYHCTTRTLDCARAIEAGGASEVVVHARTKADGYKPPAYWDRIRAVRGAVGIPVIANGEIWNVGDARRCREESGCDAIMLGRGMVRDPGLALKIRGDRPAGLGWEEMLPLLARFWETVGWHNQPRHQAGRLKQWLNFLRKHYPQAEEVYASIRTVTDPAEAGRMLFGEGERLAA
jgi:tRNA-dihydrouridine synthase C